MAIQRPRRSQVNIITFGRRGHSTIKVAHSHAFVATRVLLGGTSPPAPPLKREGRLAPLKREGSGLPPLKREGSGLPPLKREGRLAPPSRAGKGAGGEVRRCFAL